MEALYTVKFLNTELLEKHGGDAINLFSYGTDGQVEVIVFEDTIIWNSEDDGREFIEAENTYEDLAVYIRRKFNEYVDRLVVLKF